MSQSATSHIKQKIQCLKEELDKKDGEIEDLRAKLKTATEQAESAEAEARAYERKYTSMEEKLDQTEDKLYDAKKILDTVQADREDKDRELRKYIGAEEATATLIARKLVVLTTELELAEKRFEEAEADNRNYEEMLNGAHIDLKSLKTLEAKLYDAETTAEEKITLLQNKLDQMETLYLEKSRECDRLATSVDKLEDTVVKKDEEIVRMKEEMESALSELDGI